MRLATFNVETLDSPRKGTASLEERGEILRPQLARLDADVLCLQEVNSQRIKGTKTRTLSALQTLIKGTQYENYQITASRGGEGHSLADVHNLVILSKFPICSVLELRHTIVPPMQYLSLTAAPLEISPQPIHFERPILIAELALPDDRTMTVVNLHLRAPLASTIAGQKESAFVWKNTAAWAEGFFLSSMKRNAQALELRLAIDNMLDTDARRLLAICGDFNAEDHETPIKLLQAGEDDTGNGHLSARSLVIADRALPQDRRFSVVHHGRAQMLDHILISRHLAAFLKGIEVHNETLPDEAASAGMSHNAPGSYHAPVVAEFSIYA